jgi:hypothetical protein
VIPVPGRTVVTGGTKLLFRIWITFALTRGVWIGDGVGGTVVSTEVRVGLMVTVVTFAVAVSSTVKIGVGLPVIVSEGFAIVASVVGAGVVTVEGADCVHPVTTKKRITKIHSPSIFFMKNRFQLLVIKFIELIALALSLSLT